MGKKKNKKIMMTVLPSVVISSVSGSGHSSKSKNTLPWQWASCNHPHTMSFRAMDIDPGHEEDDDGVKVIVSSQGMFEAEGSASASCFFTSISSDSPRSHSHTHSNSTDVMPDDVQLQLVPDESLELVVRGARSDRLFFEPQPGDTSSILSLTNTNTASPFKESVVVAMESENPYADFRRSMEEMVESHRNRMEEGCFCLEDLLRWYLRMNGTENHGFIVQAFVDLLFNLTC